MSLQAQPQQPAQVYPTTVTNHPSNNSHHSNGSFGTVFIVLAIILVISTVACFLGRLCNRRYNNNKNHHHSHHQSQRPGSNNSNKQQQIHNFQPREEGDIEFGVDKRAPPPTTAWPNKGISPPFHGPAGTGSLHPPPNNYGNNTRDFEMKSDHEGELRSSV